MNPSGDGHPGHGILFTDSGYASAPLGDPYVSSAVARASREKNSDSETVISTGTRVAQAVAQNLISELCNDIHARIQRHVGANIQNVLLDVVPDLLKAFALRLAQMDPSPANREITHFVYNHRS